MKKYEEKWISFINSSQDENKKEKIIKEIYRLLDDNVMLSYKGI